MVIFGGVIILSPVPNSSALTLYDYSLLFHNVYRLFLCDHFLVLFNGLQYCNWSFVCTFLHCHFCKCWSAIYGSQFLIVFSVIP